MKYLKTFETYTFEDFTHSDIEDVKELLEEGLDIEQIAIELDFSLDKVKQIVDSIRKNQQMFNEAKITRTENVSTDRLLVGDTIIYTGTRRYGSGEQVKVTRVAEKSIQLSNGKRVARTYSNYKKRVTGVMKIVDDRGQQPTTESRWIRKRII